MSVTADDLDAATASVAHTLLPVTDRSWADAAGTGTWDAWHTAEHLGDTLTSFAAQLVARPTTRFVRFLSTADEDASAGEVLEVALTGAGILGAALRQSGPDVRAYHPSGLADPEGFAGMGCVEVLVHGEDVARGLGVAVDPPRDVCARVLARMFPDVAPSVAREDPWDALLWATHRLDLPGHLPRPDWQWQAAP